MKALDLRFLSGAKRADHEALFHWVDHSLTVASVSVRDEHGVCYRFRFLQGVSLNDRHFDLEVNFLEYWERRPNAQERHFTWVTDLPIDQTQVMALMRAGRARWRIESETLRTPGPAHWTR